MIMKTHKLLAVLLSLFMSLNTVGICYAEEGSSEETTIEDNYDDQSNNDEFSTHTYNEVISDYADDIPYYESDVETYTAIPSSFELDKQIYPDVRNQGSYGTCWAFAALGLSEFDLINKNLADKSIDLSELQLAHFVYNSSLDPLGGTAGDQSQYYNGSTSYSYLDRGGMYEYAVRRLSQWSGAVNESDVPYNTENINNVLNNGLDSSYAYSKDIAHLENAYVMSLKNNTYDVKRAIMQHGAVGVQYYHSDSKLLWNSANQLWTYYDPQITGGGHNVMIVGWDDNFSKENFVGDQPANNGAWLIRNSWGFTQSYFWMSYENQSLLDAAWVFDMNRADNYDNNYQLDGGINTYNVTNNICYYKTYSNVFTVQNKENITSEDLKAVSLSFTHVSNVNYKIEVYTDLKSNNPYSGTKQEQATTEGTTTYAGLYTIPLTQSIQLTPGSSFAIVVTTDKYALDYEQGINWEKDGVKVWDAPVSSNNGKSFYGNSNYQWNTGWYNGNFCIKAFTTNNYRVQQDIGSAVISRNDDFTVDNPSITVTYGDTSTLVKDVDYTVSSTTDENGTTVTIQGQGNYTGTVSKTFIPVSSLSLKCKDIAFTGSALTPEVTVKNGDTVLTLNTDYTVRYSNNVNVSENGIATVNGIGDYYGSVDVPFQIYNDIGEVLKTYSLSLNGLIEFNFSFNISDELLKDPNAYIQFTLPDGREQKQFVKNGKYINGMYRFSCGVYAHEMTQKVKFYIVNGNGTIGKKYSYSIEDYCKNPLAGTDEVSERVKPLIKSMLNYGGYAQDEFSKYLDNKAYKEVKLEFEDEMSNLKFTDLQNYIFKYDDEDENFSPRGVALILMEGTTLRIFINVKNHELIAKTKVTIDGKEAYIKSENNNYFIDIPAVQSNKLDEEHIVQIGDLKMTCSALSYVYTCLKNSTVTNDINVAKAIYLYFLRSKAYFG